MALIEFELKKDHIALLSNLNWSYNDYGDEKDDINLPKVNSEHPFGEVSQNIYEQCVLILYGYETDIDDDNIIDFKFDEERKKHIDSLLYGLDIATNIIMRNKTFEPGIYVKRMNDYTWKYKKKGDK